MMTAKSKRLVKRLQALEIKEGEAFPPEALEILTELSKMATKLVKTRSKRTTRPRGRTVPKKWPVDCRPYNTYWNSFLWLLGFCDDCAACLGWCEQ